MKITIPRHNLWDIVNKVKSVVSAKSALPILSHILIEADDNRIRIAATDLKVSIECSVDCTVEEAGALTISCQRLSSMLAELPDDDIYINKVDDGIIELKCGRIETRLYSMAPDEFPPIRSFDGITPMVFKQGTLKKLFSRASFAICSDQARYNLTGLLVEAAGNKLTVVATDGRRLSMAVENNEISTDNEFKVIIPAKMIHELESLLGDDEDVDVFIDESQGAFVFNNVRMVTALIEGNFPNYDMVVPKDHDKEAVLYTGLFTEAMRRTRIMTNDKFNSVEVHLTKGIIRLKVLTPEVGEYEEDMPVDYDGDDICIAFNPDFILDILRRIETEKVCIILKDVTSPGLIKPYTDAPVDDYINVVMPIRI